MRHLGLAALALFILLPLVQALLLSFTATLPTAMQGSIGLMNYRGVLATAELRAAMVNSLIYVTLNVALCIGIGVFPGTLYRLLPFAVDYEPYTASHIVAQLRFTFDLPGALVVTPVVHHEGHSWHCGSTRGLQPVLQASTVAMEEEPLDSKISETIRTV